MFSAVSTIWVLIAAALVFFMQAGFAMCEAGFTRAKNTGNILMKNLMDFSLGTIVFWLLGFGIMFGGSTLIFGGFDFFTTGDYSAILPAGVPLYAFLIFQTVFCATAATIVSGAMAERTKFIGYIIYSLVISALIYPISGHWVWGGGWLSQLGFHDFAGSTVVHMVGGVAALVGAKILGARIGKYDKNGKPRAILGHNLSIAALGVFILWFGWFGFNPGSTVSMGSDDSILAASSIFVTTNMAAAAACAVTMIYTWLRYGKPDVSLTLNAALGGLVAITAGCDAVTPGGAAIIGALAGIVMPLGIEFFDKVAKIDDPVGAISVHGVCGALGTILVGFLAVDGGVFYGGGWGLVSVQVLGVVSVAAWVAIAMIIVFQIIKHTVGLRVSVEDEIRGLDSSEHGLASSYSDFALTTSIPGGYAEFVPEVTGSTHIDEAVPVVLKTPETSVVSDVKISRIDIIINQSKFETLKAAMEKIGVAGMTVINVLGCGTQKGRHDFYRGVEVEMQLLPKVKIEIVVSKVPVSTIIEVAKKALYTGHIGDGKIFVYDVENVVRVRTGEEGYNALQFDE